jgi:arginase family enzyme
MRIIVPYEAGARFAAKSESMNTWRTVVGESPFLFFERHLGPLIPHLLSATIRQEVMSGEVPLIMGGDHSLTWYVLKALVDILGPINVVHLDAHHDAYADVVLSNFSVFYHISRYLPVKLFPVGWRYECEPVSARLNRKVLGPTYVSIDLDYFDPKLIPSVRTGVPSAMNQFCDFEAYAYTLEQIEGPIVGADLVEWLGAPIDSQEYAFVHKVYELIDRRMKKTDEAGTSNQ